MRLATPFSLLSLLSSSSSAADCDGCFCVPSEGNSCPTWTPVDTYDQDVIDAFYAKKMTNVVFSLTCNPYEDNSCTSTPPMDPDTENSVCAFKYNSTDCSTYTMITYPSREAADADGAYITHTHACGLCSTAQDLAT